MRYSSEIAVFNIIHNLFNTTTPLVDATVSETSLPFVRGAAAARKRADWCWSKPGLKQTMPDPKTTAFPVNKPAMNASRKHYYYY